MRAGFAVLLIVEVMMESFTAKVHGIDTEDGSGYRTVKRNLDTKNAGNSRVSLTSHHLDGLAADIVLGNFVNPPQEPPKIKCQILAQAKRLVGQNGASKDENTPNSVHISIPTLEHEDKWNCTP